MGQGKRGRSRDNVWEEIERREKKLQANEKRERIGNSRYNKWYCMIKNEGLPGYLKKRWGESRWKRIARFRLGNEMRERADTGESKGRGNADCVEGNESLGNTCGRDAGVGQREEGIGKRSAEECWGRGGGGEVDERDRNGETENGGEWEERGGGWRRKGKRSEEEALVE